jgi:hypothetical protein
MGSEFRIEDLPPDCNVKTKQPRLGQAVHLRLYISNLPPSTNGDLGKFTPVGIDRVRGILLEVTAAAKDGSIEIRDLRSNTNPAPIAQIPHEDIPTWGIPATLVHSESGIGKTTLREYPCRIMEAPLAKPVS